MSINIHKGNYKNNPSTSGTNNSIKVNNSPGTGGYGVYGTSVTTNGNSNTFTNIPHTSSINTIKYFILGEEYDTHSYYTDPTTASIIATLNVLGEPYWVQLKKQNATFDSEIGKFIEEKLKRQRRSNNIDKIIDED